VGFVTVPAVIPYLPFSRPASFSRWRGSFSGMLLGSEIWFFKRIGFQHLPTLCDATMKKQ